MSAPHKMKEIIMKFLLLLTFLISSLAQSAELPDLHKHAALGDLPRVKGLIDQGVNLFELEGEMGASVLHKAAVSNNPQLITYLVEQGAFVDLQAPTNNMTPLHDAVLYRKPLNVEALLKAGARTDLKSVWGPTAYEFAKSLELKEVIAMFEKHFQKRALPQVVLDLHKGIIEGDGATVLSLLKAGVSVEARNAAGNTPLIEAARNQQHEIAKILIEFDADPNATGLTMRANAGHKAAYRGDAAMLELLIGSGRLNLDAQGPYNGYSILLDTLWHGYEEAAIVVLHAGANPQLKTHTGLTALDLARAHKLDRVIELIEGSWI